MNPLGMSVRLRQLKCFYKIQKVFIKVFDSGWNISPPETQFRSNCNLSSKCIYKHTRKVITLAFPGTEESWCPLEKNPPHSCLLEGPLQRPSSRFEGRLATPRRIPCFFFFSSFFFFNPQRASPSLRPWFHRSLSPKRFHGQTSSPARQHKTVLTPLSRR